MSLFSVGSILKKTPLSSGLTAGYNSVDVGVAPSGYGSQYDDLFAANPYRDLSYRVSGLQALMSNLGFRTKYDDFVDQARINAEEYDAGIMSQIQQNEFNDPSSMAARERAAGINPDIAGIGDVASAAGPTEDPNGMNVNPTGDEAAQIASLVGGFAQGVFTAFTKGVSMMKDLKGIEQLNSVIEGQDIANVNSMMSTLDRYILSQIKPEDLKSDVAFAGALNQIQEPDWSAWGLSSKNSSRGSNMFYNQVYSLSNDAKARELARQRYSDIVEGNKSRASGYYSENEMEAETIDIMIGGLAQTARDIEKQTASNKLTEANVTQSELVNRGITADIETQHLDTLNQMDYGQMLGQAEGAATESQSWLSKYQGIINKNKAEFYKALQDSAAAGNVSSQRTLYFMALQDMMSFEVNGSGDFNFLRGLASLAETITGKNSKSSTGSSLKKSFGLGFDFGFTARSK